MKRKIEVSVGSLSGALDRFERVWKEGEAGRGRRVEIRLTFESLPRSSRTSLRPDGHCWKRSSARDLCRSTRSRAS
jgi:hypothetical protein